MMEWTTKSFFFFCFLLVSSFQLKAQEELGNLWNRSKTGMFLNEENQDIPDALRATDEVKITYLFKPIALPIRDDFTKYRIKHFVNDTNDASVFDSLSYSFTVNGSYVDSLYYQTDTIYDYTYNPFTKRLDSSLAPILKIEFYHDSINPFKITDTWFVFPNFSSTTQNGITRKTYYQEDSVLIDTVYRHFFAKDDDNSLWINDGAFWNRTMSLNPPTIGVITFDGLNNQGKPYDNSGRLIYGKADVFSSKPINLYSDKFGRYTSSDSVYLSFFVQPFGNGDQPEVEDSLLLEFYSPTEQRWNLVWSKKGDTLQEFKQIYIHIADSAYLQVGFQFRFRNYATLSGNFDHWHIDYIQLDKNRSVKENIFDFAFTQPIRTLLKLYTSAPWTHYKSNPKFFMGNETIWQLRNLGPKTDIAPSNYNVHINGEVNPFFKSKTKTTISVPASDTFSITHSLNSAPNYFSFPTDTFERQLFKARLLFSATQEPTLSRDNDTVSHFQLFDRFYSYDDGTAEKTYHINLVGTTVVVEFETPIEDTLRSVMINFVETFEPPENQKINIVVYTDLNSNPVYQSGPVDVIYNGEGKFYRYNIDPVVVDGLFYVGYQQLTQSKTFVGYDVNFNNQNRTFISQIDGDWSNSIFLGTSMIRASFGEGNEPTLSTPKVISINEEGLKFYPNPAQNFIYFNEDVNSEIEIYSLGGKLELREYVGNELNISQFPNGFYLVKTENRKAAKLIIAR